MQTYTLARNFEHKDITKNTLYELYYRSRFLAPLLQILVNASKLVKENRPMLLKYIIHSVHDLNIAQILDFLGYYKSKGFKEAKVIDFLASVRFEMV